MSGSWWAIYEFSGTTIDYKINLGLGDDSHEINPASPIQSINSTNLTGTVRILGDLALTRPAKQWTSHLAARKDGIISHLDTTGTLDPFSDFDHGLLIPRDKVDLTGQTCNKIGVSYPAFNQQSNRCNGRVGDCLKNQIQDLIDEGRSGLPDQFCRGLGQWVPDGDRLSCTINERHVTQVLLELDATDILVMVGDPNAVILSATASVELAMSQRTVIDVAIENTDSTLMGDYILGLKNCHASVYLAAGGSAISVGPSSTVQTRIFVESKTELAGTYNCLVELRGSSTGIFMDSREVEIVLQARAVDKHAQDGETSTEIAGVGESKIDSSSAKATCKTCSSFNIFCVVRHGCTRKIFKLLGSGFGTLTLLFFLISKGPLIWSCMKCLCKRRKNSQIAIHSDKYLHYGHHLIPGIPLYSYGRPKGASLSQP